MLFLDDFLEMLDELPSELRDRCREIKALDVSINADHVVAGEEVKKYFDVCESMSTEDRRKKVKELREKYDSLRVRSERKVALTEGMQELLEKYTQHLEKEKTHLKFELEADNAGVTEIIEKRFADYVEQMFSARKDRRKRPHPGSGSGVNGGGEGTMNGSGAGEKAAADEPCSSTSSRSMSVSLPSSSKLLRLDSSGSEATSPSPSSSSAAPVPRARKHSLPLTKEEAQIKEARREAIRQQLQASLHLKTARNSATYKESSPCSSTGSRGERASSSRRNGSIDPMYVSINNGFNPEEGPYSPSPYTTNATAAHHTYAYHVHHNTPPGPPPSTPTLSSSMPNFVTSESRHGRARKLTSRVQEMFNSNQSLTGHRERARHHSTASSSAAAAAAAASSSSSSSHHHHAHHQGAAPPGGLHSTSAAAAAVSPHSASVITAMGNITPPSEDQLQLHQPPPAARFRDERSGDDEGNDERPWCFCNEKSYGGMVACDCKECPYEWFHWPCVGLDAAPRGKWFCPHCEEKRAEKE